MPSPPGAGGCSGVLGADTGPWTRVAESGLQGASGHRHAADACSSPGSVPVRPGAPRSVLKPGAGLPQACAPSCRAWGGVRAHRDSVPILVCKGLLFWPLPGSRPCRGRSLRGHGDVVTVGWTSGSRGDGASGGGPHTERPSAHALCHGAREAGVCPGPPGPPETQRTQSYSSFWVFGLILGSLSYAPSLGLPRKTWHAPSRGPGHGGQGPRLRFTRRRWAQG